MKKVLRGRHYVSDEEVALKTVKRILRGRDTRSHSKVELFRETETMLRIKDVIHIGQVSFWCMIDDPVSVIIPVLKKKALLFDSPSYIYSIN